MINFSKVENISNLIDLEKVSLNSTLEIQKNFNKQILIFVKKLMNNIDLSLDSNDKASFYLNESTSALNKSNSNIDLLKKLLTTLSILDVSDESSIKNYNNKFKEIMNSVYSNTESIEKFIHEITITDFSESSILLTSSCINPEVSANITQNVSKSIPENTLIISEKQDKVILPYKIDKVQEILQTNMRYHSVEEVVNKLYTKPISYYKFSSLARFKEAYTLVRVKEKGSRLKALSLAFELLGNYSLHPAIITACKSLDELDIYLACLDENSLDDFKFFNIKYEVPLAVSKFANNNI